MINNEMDADRVRDDEIHEMGNKRKADRYHFIP